MTAANVRVATNGLLFAAPAGTALPDAYDDTLDAEFKEFGEVSEDGLERAFETSSEVVRNWRRQALRNLTTEVNATFKVMFLDTAALEVDKYFGGTTETNPSGGSKLTVGQPDNTAFSLVIELEDSSLGDQVLLVVPRAVVTEREPITESAADVTGYGLTFAALYDDAIDGLFTIYFPTDLTSA